MQPRESAFALDKTLRSASRVSRRRLVVEFIFWLGVFALVAALVSCLLVLIVKLAWIAPVPWVTFAALAGVAMVAAGIAAGRGAWSRERAAREIDRSLGLDNTLGSALELRASHREEERLFVKELISRAERLAESAKVDRAVNLRLGAAWYVWPIVVAIAVACYTWIPDRSIRAAAQAKKRAQESKQAAAEIRAIAKSIGDAPKPPTPDETTNRLDQNLTEIEEELEAGRLTAHDARVRTAEELNKHAEAIESKARQSEATVEETRRALARAAARARQSPAQDASRLSEALRQGDLEAAAAEIDRLGKTANSEERENAARTLERIADNLKPDSPSNAEKPPSEAASKPDAPAGAPPESQSERLREASKAAAEELRKPPAEPQTPNQQQDQPKQDSSREDAPKQPETGNTPSREPDHANPPGQPQPNQAPPNQPPPGNASDPSKPSGETKPPAQGSGEKPEAPKQPEQSPQNDANKGDQSAQGEQKKQGDQPSPSGQPNAGDQPKQQPGNDKSSQQSPGQPQQQPNRAPNGSGQESKSAERRPEQPANGTSQQPGGQQQQTEKPGSQPSAPSPDNAKQSPGRSDPSGTQPQNQPVPGRQPTEIPGQSGEQSPRSEPGKPGSGTQKLAEELRDLAQNRTSAQQQRETARGMRDRAEQMLENASPEERARLADLAKRLAASDRANPAGAPAPWRGPTQTFDARPDTASTPVDSSRPAERTIAEWLSEPKPGGTAPAGAIPQEPIRRATESARQAIEQQAIPPQYSDLVRRVFKRYAESAQGSGEQK